MPHNDLLPDEFAPRGIRAYLVGIEAAGLGLTIFGAVSLFGMLFD